MMAVALSGSWHPKPRKPAEGAVENAAENLRPSEGRHAQGARHDRKKCPEPRRGCGDTDRDQGRDQDPGRGTRCRKAEAKAVLCNRKWPWTASRFPIKADRRPKPPAGHHDALKLKINPQKTGIRDPSRSTRLRYSGKVAEYRIGSTILSEKTACRSLLVCSCTKIILTQRQRDPPGVLQAGSKDRPHRQNRPRRSGRNRNSAAPRHS